MSEDIRISVDFLTHRKRRKLQRKLGAAGVLSAIDLWLSAAQQRPQGTLIDYTVDDIEIDANWEGDSGLFVETLLEVGFLDENDGVYSLHNWETRQGWVSESEDRADKARFSKLAQVNSAIYKKLKEKGVDRISKEEYREYKKMPKTASKAQSEPPAIANKPQSEPPAIDSKSLAPAPAPAPSPSPSPSPAYALKETPGTAPGDFSDFKKAGPKNVARKVKPKNATKDTAGYFQDINRACLQICDLPAKKKPFNPYEWAQKQITQRGHPGAVAESLQGLVMFWASAESPWSYASTILKTKNGNWNEADAIKIHEEMKALNPKELEGLTQGLFKTVKGDR